MGHEEQEMEGGIDGIWGLEEVLFDGSTDWDYRQAIEA